MMKTPRKQLEYAKTYLGKFDEIKVRVPGGEKAKLKEYATKRGESLNGFILRAIAETMEKKCACNEVRGEWVDLRESSKDVPRSECSICGRVIIGLESAYNFCPKCGANMKG